MFKWSFLSTKFIFPRDHYNSWFQRQFTKAHKALITPSSLHCNFYGKCWNQSLECWGVEGKKMFVSEFSLWLHVNTHLPVGCRVASSPITAQTFKSVGKSVCHWVIYIDLRVYNIDKIKDNIYIFNIRWHWNINTNGVLLNINKEVILPLCSM